MSKVTADEMLLGWLRLTKQQGAANTGWIRTVRLQQHIQGKQLAKKMQVSPARVSVLERDEQRGAVTLKMMQKAADALDCTFVYALVPKSAHQQTKPKIRLDTAHMKEDKARQVSDLQQEYERSLAKTTRS